MGACDFQTIGHGATLSAAFSSAVDQAAWEYGHGGYSGTIAEKSDVVLIEPPTGVKPRKYAEWLLYGDAPIPSEYASKVKTDTALIDDKWGPAGAIALDPDPSSGTNRWLFFGWASS